MPAAKYEQGRDQLGEGNIDLLSDDIRAILCDASDIGTAITGATNATPIVITATSHGLSDGDVVLITGVGGNTAANTVAKVANKDANTFELTDFEGNNIAGSGSYTSGGVVVDLTSDQNLDDIAAGSRVAVSGALASKTLVRGVFDAADVVLSSVTGDACDLIILYKHTGVESTSTLLWCIAQGTGLPITPSGGDITIAWDSGALKIARI